MLGRTAGALFWLSRYVERAENLARMLDVGYRIAMMPGDDDGHQEEWRSTLVNASCEAEFFEKYDTLETSNVVDFLLLDRDNPGSVYSCLEMARSNAKAVRTAMTREMWESLNTTWLELSGIKPGSITSNILPGFLDWVKQRSALFRGALLGTLLRKDNFHFSQLGAFVERADNTARILDVKYYILLPENEAIGGGIDNYHWSTVLRSVSGHRSYRHFYHDSYKPWKIADFLILRREMPRSLIHCYGMINDSFAGLEELYNARYHCHDAAAAMLARLGAGDMEQIFQEGLHEFLQDVISRNNALSQDISATYHFTH